MDAPYNFNSKPKTLHPDPKLQPLRWEASIANPSHDPRRPQGDHGVPLPAGGRGHVRAHGRRRGARISHSDAPRPLLRRQEGLPSYLTQFIYQ